MADRAELLRNALSFLADPNTRNHPLTQRIAFLESKGLTSAEIESVLAQSGNISSSVHTNNGFGPAAPAPSYAAQYNVVQRQPPIIPQRDWRDYFIMAVVSGGFIFGVVSFARKYLLPHLRPPSVTAYEADQGALTAQFDQISALITAIESDTASQRTGLDEQRVKVDGAIDKIQIALNETREAELRTKADLRDIREEVNNVRDLLPKMLEKNKDAQSQALLDLQQELKSLKALLLSRGSPSTGANTFSSALYSASASPGLAVTPPRPTIPSWQLAGSSPVPVMSTPAAVPNASVASETADLKGKGKAASATNGSDTLASSGVLVSQNVNESEDDGVIA